MRPSAISKLCSKVLFFHYSSLVKALLSAEKTKKLA